MSTFLFASIPIPAHTTNPLPIAARLVERGHRVLWYAGKVFHPQIAAVGAEPSPYVNAEDFGGQYLTEYWPQFKDLPPIQVIRRAFADVFVGHAPQRVADLRQIIAGTPVGAMLCDALMFGVGLTSELEGVPWATFGDGPLPFEEPDRPRSAPVCSRCADRSAGCAMPSSGRVPTGSSSATPNASTKPPAPHWVCRRRRARCSR